MPEPTQTINEDGIGQLVEEPTDTTDASSASETSSDGLIETVDIAAPAVEDKPSEETIKAQAETDEKAKAEEEAKAKEDEKAKAEAEAQAKAEEEAADIRFDKSKRFRQMNERIKSAETDSQALRQEIDALKQGMTKPDSTEQEPDYINIADKTEEELREWQDEDPKGYAANLVKQAKAELLEELRSEQTQKERQRNESSFRDRAEQTHQEFAKTHPDFDDMFDSGELIKFAKENPGHNLISAYFHLKSSNNGNETQKLIDAAVKKAIAETEAKVIKQFKTKGHASVLGAGPSAPTARTTQEIPLDLQDTKKFGGTATVLANRLKARREAKLAGAG